MQVLKRCLVILAVLTAMPAAAADMKAGATLAQQKACLACHAVDKKVVGPSYRDVAKKYKGKTGAVELMAGKIKKGGAGVWGNIPMPANNVSDAEAKLLAQWVLAH